MSTNILEYEYLIWKDLRLLKQKEIFLMETQDYINGIAIKFRQYKQDMGSLYKSVLAVIS